MGLPNYITLLRIGLLPVFVVCFYIHYQWALWLTVGIFAFAALTDWLDGFLARMLKQSSRLGAFLDPVADKLIVAVALVLLVKSSTLPLLELPAVVIISREIVITALREWMAEIGKRASVAVSYVGKIKTAFQLIAILLLLVSRTHLGVKLPFLEWGGYSLLILAAILTLWTMVMYLRAAWPELVIGTKIDN